MRRRLLLALLALAPPAAAHEGPPYPIFVDERVGPYLASVWTDPDVGIGTFFVMLDPPAGQELPARTRVELRVRPSDGRLAEAAHAAREERRRGGGAKFVAEVPFDAVGPWEVRILVAGSEGGGELGREVEVTPPGLGRWDLLWYFAPFAIVGGLWILALRRRQELEREHAARG